MEEHIDVIPKLSSGIVFQLAVLAFVAVGVDYLDVVFNTSTRWVFMVLLMASLMPRGEIFMAYRTRFAPFILIYLLWCFATALWSAVPMLSLLKATALFIVTTAFMGGGQVWARRQQTGNPLFYLLPVVATALFAGLLERPSSIQFSTGITIYEGLAGNPNYLGMLTAIALPLPLYQAYVAWNRANKPWLAFWAAITATLLVLLWRSGSRASLLCALAILATFALIANRGQRISMIVLAVTLFTGVTIAAPELEHGVYQRVVIKSSVGGDAFFSRQQPWEKTWEGAMEGGMLGLGYGVSSGYTDFTFDLTSNTYGREKGNAQLAVWEETGLVGLVLYVALIFMMFQELFAGLSWLSDPAKRAEVALYIGLITGFLVQSVFEAWWTSPGSMESAAFWATVGVASGRVQSLMPRRAPAEGETVRASFMRFRTSTLRSFARR